MMARTHESAVQRIQVGVFGLLAVLLFVYIANLIVDRVARSPASSAEVDRQVQSDQDQPKDDPLAELGVTPVVEDAAQADVKTNPPAAR